MTCKAIEADSGIFTLGSKPCPVILSILVEIILTFLFLFSLHYSGRRTRHRLALLRLHLHRTIHVNSLRQQGRVHHLGSEQCHFLFGR